MYALTCGHLLLTFISSISFLHTHALTHIIKFPQYQGLIARLAVQKTLHYMLVPFSIKSGSKINFCRLEKEESRLWGCVKITSLCFFYSDESRDNLRKSFCKCAWISWEIPFTNGGDMLKCFWAQSTNSFTNLELQKTSQIVMELLSCYPALLYFLL